MFNLLIVAGELSGDNYAHHLITQLRKDIPNIRIWAIGGPKLAQSADHIITNIAECHAIGITEQWQAQSKYKKMMSQLRKETEKTHFNHAIILDFQHQNIKIGRHLQQKDIPITTFITPNFWLYKDTRSAKKIIQYSAHIFTIYEEEYHFYKTLTPHCSQVGHPLLFTQTVTQPTADKQSPPTPPYKLGICPGSRPQEIQLLWPKIKKALLELHQKNPQYEIHILPATPTIKEKIEKECHLIPFPTTVSDMPSREFYKKIDILISATGTTTLDAALSPVPVIILGALSPLTYLIAKYILRIKMAFMGLPNIISKKEITPEFIQNKLQPQSIAEKIEALCKTPQRETVLDAYTTLKKELLKQKNPFTTISQYLQKYV